MQRRRFLKGLGVGMGLGLAGAALSQRGLVAMEPGQAVALQIAEQRLARVPVDFVGLSFESPQLYNPGYFAPSNRTLVTAFRELSPGGVLRSGGHLSDVSRWSGEHGDFATPKQVAGIARGKTYWEWKLTDPSVRENMNGAITPAAIRSLKGFLDATGWRLIYGLNFGCGSTERAADEAGFVAKTMGDRLLAFQVGNEDDQFAGNPVFRSADFDFDRYFAEYRAFVAAVRGAVPEAKFGGPDVATNMRWVQRFADEPGNAATFLSSHFYAMGPAKDPAMDATYLLKPNERLAQQMAQVRVATQAAKGMPYRMTEGNSCFGGGKPGVSDAFASALWGADYLLQCAAAGYAGVNLHGGGDGIYTPLAVGPQMATERRPLYFGMQFAQRFGGADLYPVVLRAADAVTAYCGRRGGATMLAVINKGPAAVTLELPRALMARGAAKQEMLSGPSLDAKTGVTFAAVAVDWQSKAVLAPYTAVLLTWS